MRTPESKHLIFFNVDATPKPADVPSHLTRFGNLPIDVGFRPGFLKTTFRRGPCNPNPPPTSDRNPATQTPPQTEKNAIISSA